MTLNWLTGSPRTGSGGNTGNCTGPTIKHCNAAAADTGTGTGAGTPDANYQAAVRAQMLLQGNNGLDGVVHMAHSKSLAGPWALQSGDSPVLRGRQGRWDAAATNPAPHILSNGTALLVYRGVNGLATGQSMQWCTHSPCHVCGGAHSLPACVHFLV